MKKEQNRKNQNVPINYHDFGCKSSCFRICDGAGRTIASLGQLETTQNERILLSKYEIEISRP